MNCVQLWLFSNYVGLNKIKSNGQKQESVSKGWNECLSGDLKAKARQELSAPSAGLPPPRSHDQRAYPFWEVRLPPRTS